VVGFSGAAACADDEAGPASSAPPTTAAAPTIVTTMPAAPTSSVTPTTSGVVPVGFELAPAEVTLPDGTVCELCLWVAESAAQRQRGLMGVTDLGPADGMVFVYDGPASGQFWMYGTPMPLSIAFFAADGRFVSSADMDPCVTGPQADCARYSAAGPYVAAIELPQGGFAELGIGAGSRLALFTGDGCPPGEP
jgi:uncharacterized membrane protein (UPF0127 family)